MFGSFSNHLNRLARYPLLLNNNLTEMSEKCNYVIEADEEKNRQ